MKMIAEDWKMLTKEEKEVGILLHVLLYFMM